jgi:hypothetical protein
MVEFTTPDDQLEHLPELLIDHSTERSARIAHLSDDAVRRAGETLWRGR